MASEEKAQKLLTLGVFEYAVARMNLLFQRQEEGKGLSQNDFTNELKSKLEHIDPDLFATADEVDEVLDQYFPGDVDPDPIPPNDENGGQNEDVGQGGGEDSDDDETLEAGAAEDEVSGGGPDLDDLE